MEDVTIKGSTKLLNSETVTKIFNEHNGGFAHFNPLTTNCIATLLPVISKRTLQWFRFQTSTNFRTIKCV